MLCISNVFCTLANVANCFLSPARRVKPDGFDPLVCASVQTADGHTVKIRAYPRRGLTSEAAALLFHAFHGNTPCIKQ